LSGSIDIEAGVGVKLPKIANISVDLISTQEEVPLDLVVNGSQEFSFNASGAKNILWDSSFGEFNVLTLINRDSASIRFGISLFSSEDEFLGSNTKWVHANQSVDIVLNFFSGFTNGGSGYVVIERVAGSGEQYDANISSYKFNGGLSADLDFSYVVPITD